MTEPTRCLLVGFGARVTGTLLPTVREGDVPLRVTTVVDPDPSTPARGREFAAAGLISDNVRVCPGLDEALDRQADYDVAIVACPHDQHQTAALRLLRAGVAVWKEKPFALTVDDAFELAAHADRGLRVLVQRPHSQLYALAEQALAWMGPVLSYRMRIARPTGDYSTTWRASGRQAGGGAIVDLGYHAFDLIARLAPVAHSVYAATPAAPAHRPQVEIEESAHLLLTHDGGVSGSLYVSRCDDRADVIELCARHGRITLTESSARLTLDEPGGLPHDVDLTAAENPRARMLAHHLATLRDVSISRGEARVGVRATAMIEAAYASLRLGRPAAVARAILPQSESVSRLEGAA